MQSSTLRSQAASLPVLRQRARSSRLHFYKARSQVCRSRGPAQPAAQASRDELQASQQPKVLEKIRHMLTGTASRVFAACAVAALLVRAAAAECCLLFGVCVVHKFQRYAVLKYA